MAIASTTVWELNASATAANACGGGFNPSNASVGTDYTLLANNANYPAAKYSFTDLASTNGTTNPAVVTSASHNFVAADNGNIIHITAGTNWTAGWYEIVSTSGNAATLDRAAGTSATLSGGSYQVGGALSLNSSTANQTDSSFFAGAVVAGNTIWMKNGAFTAGITFTTAAGTVTAPIMWHGYNASRGDAPTGPNRPTMAMGALAPILNTWWVIDNIIFTGTAASIWNLGGNDTLSNVKVVNSSTTAAQVGVLCATSTTIRNCELISYRGTCLSVAGQQVYIFGSYIHDSNIGVTATTGFIIAGDSIFADNVTSAIQTTSTGSVVSLVGNTFYGAENKLGTALLNFNSTNGFMSLNNIIYGFATGTSTTGVYPGITEDYNNYFNNTTDVNNATKGPHDIAVNPAFQGVAQLTGTAGVISSATLTDSGANFSTVTDNVDFCYIKSGTGATAGKYLITGHTATTLTLFTAPGGSGTNIVYQVTTGHNFAIGANLRTNGFPGVFPGSLTTGYLSPGAAQPATTVASVFVE